MNREFAVFPLGTAFLPGDKVSLNVFEPRYLEMLSSVLVSDRQFVSVLISKGSEVGGEDHRFGHGVLIDIEKVLPTENALFVEGTAIAVVDVTEWLPDEPYPTAMCILQQSPTLSTSDRIKNAKSLSLSAQRLRILLQKLSFSPSGLPPEGILQSAIASIASGRWWEEQTSVTELEEVLWLLARCVPIGALDRYDLLRNSELARRIQQLDLMIEHVTEIAEFQSGE